MKILAIDSTAAAASVAVTENEKTLAALYGDAGKTHSQVLLPMALEACAIADIALKDADAFAVTVGPGSFTGVRIGVSCVKGIAFGTQKPCVAVSSLEALAEAAAKVAGEDGALLCPVMDARRSEVYNALFRVENGALVRLCEDRALPAKALCEELRQRYASATVLLCGDGTAVARAAMENAAELVLRKTPDALLSVDAAAVARCAYRAILRGDVADDAALAPVYLRLPQAERERLEREKNKEKSI